MYLEKRRNLWYALHPIPPSLRLALGKVRFVKSLGTDNYERAKTLGAQAEAEWRALIDHVRARVTELAGPNPNPMEQAFAQVRVSEEPQPTPRPLMPPPPPLAKWLEDWATTQAGAKAAKSVHMARSTISKVSDAIALADITRGRVQLWVDEQLKSGTSPSTVKRSLSELRGYWSYIQAREIVSPDIFPFDKIHLPTAKAMERKAFPPSAISHLINKAKENGDQLLVDTIMIAAFTGARIEEICTLKLESFTNNSLIISGTKTESALRQVPIHPQLSKTLKRLANTAGADQYLLPGLKPNKYGDRSGLISKRFAKLCDDLGYGSEYVFHSIRKTFASTLWSAGVERELISQLLGHSTGHITTDVYASDPNHAVKSRAIRKIQYPGVD